MRRPTNSMVDTFKLGSRTSAINATHKPIPKAAKHTRYIVSVRS